MNNKKGSYDKRFSQKFSLDLLKLICKKLGSFPFEIESIENLPVKVTEYVNKEMDLLFLVTKPCGEQVILHIEAQTHNDKKMPNRMFLYLALLKNLYPDKKIYQICLYLGQSNCTMQNKLEINEDLTYHFYLESFKDIPYEDFLQQPSTIGFSILGDFHGEEEDTVLGHIFDSIKKIPDQHQQRNLFDLIIFGNICNLSTIVRNKLVKNMIIDITKNPVYIEAKNEGLEEGIQKGREEGIQKGREEGIQKGREEGIQKGIEKGREEATRETTLSIAKNMLRDGFNYLVVKSYTGLKDDDMLDLINEIKTEREQ